MSVHFCSFVHANSSLLFSENVKFRNLKDVITIAQLETNGTRFQTAKNVDFYFTTSFSKNLSLITQI